MALKSNSDESSSSIGVENPNLMDIFYGEDLSIHAQHAPNGSFRLGLDSLHVMKIPRHGKLIFVPLTCLYLFYLELSYMK